MHLLEHHELALDEFSYGGINELLGYFSFKKIVFRLSHSSANASGEDERHRTRFNIVIRRDRLYLAST